jgi:hypothetical protein
MNKISSFGCKQSYEAYYIAFDFFRLIVPGDTVESADVIATDSTETDVTSELIDSDVQTITGTQINVYVMGGTSGQTYKLTCKITTTAGEKYEMEASIIVKDS